MVGSYRAKAGALAWMNTQAYWDSIYRSKAPDAVSWYRPHLDRSIELIEHYSPDRSSAIIDVGAGESTLADDLLSRGYQALTVLDISPAAIETTKKRLGHRAEKIRWLLGDITQISLLSQS